MPNVAKKVLDALTAGGRFRTAWRMGVATYCYTRSYDGAVWYAFRTAVSVGVPYLWKAKRGR